MTILIKLWYNVRKFWKSGVEMKETKQIVNQMPPLERKLKGLTTTNLKIIAILAMLIDHIGAVVIPYFQSVYAHSLESFFWLQLMVTPMRLIGRIAFPIFAFLIVNGFFHTKDLKKYLIRLSLFALISEPFFDFGLFGRYFDAAHQNVFFTLAFGLVAIWGYDNLVKKKGANFIAGLFVACIGFITVAMRTDYDFYGILTIFLIYLFFNSFKQMSAALIALNLILYSGQLTLWSAIPSYAFYTYQIELQGGYGVGIQFLIYLLMISQLFSLFALLILKDYNGEKGKSFNKYFFYAFYPVHLFLLGIVVYIFKMI